MILTYKYRLKDRHAKRWLLLFAIACNQVWNYYVSTQRKVQKQWREGSKIRWPSRFDFQALTGGTSKELGIHAQTIQEICRTFVQSRDTHRHSPGFRHSFGPKRSLGWIPFSPQSRQIQGNQITYLGYKFRWFGAKRRPLPTTAKGGAFVEDAMGHWWVTFQVEVAPDNRCGEGVIGIDLGLKHLVVTSDGTKIPAFHSYRNHESALAKAQRAGNRRQVKALHAHIANIRKDYQHKLTTQLISNNKLIFVGNVSPSKLVRSKLAKSIYDASWSQFRNMLRYKASRHGARYVEVNESFTTQTCSRCGNCASSGRPKGIAGLGIREWVCSDCGASHDRDVNAARNILMIGLSAQPPVEESRRICV